LAASSISLTSVFSSTSNAELNEPSAQVCRSASVGLQHLERSHRLVREEGRPDVRQWCLSDGRRVHPLTPVLAPERPSCLSATPFRPMKPGSTWLSIRTRSAIYASGPPARKADSVPVSTRIAQAARPEIPA